MADGRDWRRDPLRRWAAALAAAAIAVLALVVGAWALVGLLANYTYRIRWLETVPLLVVVVAYFLQRGWREEAEWRARNQDKAGNAATAPQGAAGTEGLLPPPEDSEE